MTNAIEQLESLSGAPLKDWRPLTPAQKIQLTQAAKSLLSKNPSPNDNLTLLKAVCNICSSADDESILHIAAAALFNARQNAHGWSRGDD